MGRWIPMAEREGGTVPTVVLSPDFDADQIAFAATNTGLFRSRDGGKSWEVRGKGIGSFAIQSVAFSPAFKTNRTLWVGAADGGVYRSTDRGDSWTLLARLGGGSAVVDLAILPASGGTIFMAATLADGVFVSTDKGQSWKQRNGGLQDLSIIALAISPTFPQDRTAFVAVAGGMYRTVDGGKSWSQVLATAADDAVQCIAISPDYASDRTVFAGTENSGVLISRDGGNNWQATNIGLPSLSINDLALSPEFQHDHIIGAATGDGIALSADGGASWQQVGAASEVVLSLGISDSSNRIMLAGLFDKGIFRSEDGGNSWNEANQGLTAHYLIGLALSPAFQTDATMFAWGPSEGILRSVDGGQSWQPPSSDVESSNILSMAVSPSFNTNGELFAGTSAGIVHSLDRGSSWQTIGLEQEEISFLAVSPTFSRDRTLAAGAGKSVYLSTDGGNNWETLGLPSEDEVLTALAIALNPRGLPTLLIGGWREPTAELRGRLRVWARTLPGSSWVPLFSTYTNSRITTLGIPDSYDQDERFFVGNGDCVYRSLPGARERTREGTTSMWLPAGVGSRKYPVVALATSPHFSRSQTLLAAAGDSVHYSNNQGVKWQRLGTPVGDRFPISIALSPEFDRNGIVYALTIGGQLWVWDPKGSTKTA